MRKYCPGCDAVLKCGDDEECDNCGETLLSHTDEQIGVSLLLDVSEKLEKSEQKLEKVQMELHALETASWADAVQETAAWQGRAEVAESALSRARGQVAAMREAVDHFNCERATVVKDACQKCADAGDCHIAAARSSDAGKPESDVIKAARPFMDALPAWTDDEDDLVHVLVKAREMAALRRAFDLMDGKE